MVCVDGVCWVQWLVYVPVLAIGLPCNLAALWLLLRRIRRWSESTVYLSSLVLNDTLLLFSLPFKIAAYKQEWHLGRAFCWLLESLVYVNVYGSILLSVCISADRYVALRFPFAAPRLRSPCKAACVCLAVWACVCAGSMPVYYLHDDGNLGNNVSNVSRCFQGFSKTTWKKVWLLVIMETVFGLSAVAMVFCSLRVLQILRALRRRNPCDDKLRSNKSAKIVLSNLLVFLVSFVPWHVAVLTYFLAKRGTEGWSGGGEGTAMEQLRDFVHVTACVSSINCMADGACYYYILKENLEAARRDTLSLHRHTHTLPEHTDTLTLQTQTDTHTDTHTLLTQTDTHTETHPQPVTTTSSK